MRRAIVTAVIGDKYRLPWERHAAPSWQAYAQRHGYEIVLLRGPIDASARAHERSLAWQKLLMFTQPQVAAFDRVVWIDSDIIINAAAAPDICAGVPEEKIGLVEDQALLSHPALSTIFRNLNPQQGITRESRARVRYRVAGLRACFDRFFNTGVMVLSPKHHRALLEEVYARHEQTPDSFAEQMALSWEILDRNLAHDLDPRFNILWIEYKFAFYQFLRAFGSLGSLCIANALANSFFLHFAMHPQDMATYDPAVVVEWDKLTFPTSILDQLAQNLAAHRAQNAPR